MTYHEEKRVLKNEARRERITETLDEFIRDRTKEFWGDDVRFWYREIVEGLILDVLRRHK